MKNISSIFIKVLTCFLLTFAIQVVPLSVVRRFYDGVMGEVFGVGVYFLSFFMCSCTWLNECHYYVSLYSGYLS